MTETLDISRLRTFVAIDEYGGFRRAAEALYISQPTVSQHVRALERTVGQSLVEKQGRAAVLTDTGSRLLDEARAILATHDAALERLGLAPAATLVVGSTEPSAEQLLPGLIDLFRETFPRADIRYQIDRSGALLGAIEEGAIDLALVLDTGTAIAGDEVGRVPLAWYAAADWRPPAGEEAVPLLAYGGPCGIKRRAVDALAGARRPVKLAAESDTLAGIMAAARAGLGVAVLPNAGRAPTGLTQRADLPPLGDVAVKLVARQGLSLNVTRSAVAALRDFFESHG